MNEFLLENEHISQAFSLLSEKLRDKGISMEICIYGGSALVFGYRMRMATHDIDFRIVRMETMAKNTGGKQEDLMSTIRRSIRAVGLELGGDEGWMNDGVKGFVSALESLPQEADKHKKVVAEYPEGNFPSLRVCVPSLEYLLAMKSMAMRGAEEGQDRRDIKNILEELGIRDYNKAIDIVERFYPGMLPPKAFFGLQEIIGEMVSEPETEACNDDETPDDGDFGGPGGP